MNLWVQLKHVYLKKQNHSYFVIQLDTLSPAHEKLSYKQRTEVSQLSSQPKFIKNTFEFKHLPNDHSLIIKMGVYSTDQIREDSDEVYSNSVLRCAYSLPIDQSLKQKMSNSQGVQEQYVLMNKQGEEQGRATLILKVEADNLADKIQQDHLLIKALYYDPQEKDTKIIDQRIRHIGKVLMDKQYTLDSLQNRLDYLSKGGQAVAGDLVELEKEKRVAEQERDQLNNKINRLTSVEHLHIQIDLLGGSAEGLEVMRRKLQHLMERLQMEKNQYSQLSREYFNIEKGLNKQQSIQQELQSIQSAIRQQHFQVGLLQDKRVIMERDRQRIEAQEARIHHLRAELERETKYDAMGQRKADQLDLMYAQHQQDFLREKQKQAQTQRQIDQAEQQEENWQERKDILLQQLLKLRAQALQDSPQTHRVAQLRQQLEQKQEEGDRLERQLEESSRRHAMDIIQMRLILKQ